MAGRRKRNQNALGSGLYSQKPLVLVEVGAGVTSAELAELAEPLAAAAMWIAEKLDAALRRDLLHEGQRLIGLYVAVAHELNQVAAELRGGTGIKPAPLGDLRDVQFENLMTRQAKGLGLILSQCASVWQHLQDREEILGHSVITLLKAEDGQMITGDLNPTLDYLAAKMRVAKRIMRDMAANRAWREVGQVRGDDLGERLLSTISTEANDETETD
jgi:hypothetical protein